MRTAALEWKRIASQSASCLPPLCLPYVLPRNRASRTLCVISFWRSMIAPPSQPSSLWRYDLYSAPSILTFWSAILVSREVKPLTSTTYRTWKGNTHPSVLNLIGLRVSVFSAFVSLIEKRVGKLWGQISRQTRMSFNTLMTVCCKYSKEEWRWRSFLDNCVYDF